MDQLLKLLNNNLCKQLNNFWEITDGEKIILGNCLPDALERTIQCLDKTKSKYLRDGFDWLNTS